jgi:hypothetical protein
MIKPHSKAGFSSISLRSESSARTTTCGVLGIALIFSSSVLAAQTANHPVRNVVLVHGAWADGSGSYE